ncbi:MAG: PAS domain S-box protein [Candidatus Woesearchaeota archaeon]
MNKANTLNKEKKIILDTYFSLLDNFPNPIWLSDKNAKFIFYNKSWLSFIGDSGNKNKFKSWFNHIHNKDKKKFLKIFRSSFSKKNSFMIDLKLRNKDKTYHLVRTYGSPIYIDNKFLGYIGYCFDIDKLNKNEKRLIETETKFETIFKEINEAILLLNENKIIDCNDKALELFRVSKNSFLKKDILKFTPYKQPDNAISKLKFKKLLNQKIFEWQFKRKDWTLFLAEVKLTKIKIIENNGLKEYFLMIINDITEKRRIQEELIKKDQFLIKQNELLKQLSQSYSKDRIIQFYKKSLKRVLNFLNIDRISLWLIKDKYINLILQYDKIKNKYSSDKKIEIKKYPKYFKSLFKSQFIDASDARNDKRTKEFLNSYFKKYKIFSTLDIPIRIKNTVIGVLCLEKINYKKNWTHLEKNFAVILSEFFSNIIEEQILEKEETLLSIQEKKYKLIVENLFDALFIHDNKGNILDVNKMASNISGYTYKELLRKNLFDLIVDNNKLKKNYLYLGNNKKISYETRLIKKNKESIYVNISSVIISRDKKISIQTIIRDINDNKLKELKLEEINAKLKEKIEELEKFEKIAINRELKMIELKNKLAEYEQNNQNN